MGDLTAREVEVLGLMARGASNAGICAALTITRKTCETHVRNIYWKLGLRGGNGIDRRVAAVLMYLAATARERRAARIEAAAA